jgi:hypothetical protein
MAQSDDSGAAGFVTMKSSGLSGHEEGVDPSIGHVIMAAGKSNSL